MTYKSAITKLNLKPWKLFVLAIVFLIIEFVLHSVGFDGAFAVVALIVWVILLLDAVVSKIRDLIKK